MKLLVGCPCGFNDVRGQSGRTKFVDLGTEVADSSVNLFDVLCMILNSGGHETSGGSTKGILDRARG